MRMPSPMAVKLHQRFVYLSDAAGNITSLYKPLIIIALLTVFLYYIIQSYDSYPSFETLTYLANTKPSNSSSSSRYISTSSDHSSSTSTTTSINHLVIGIAGSVKIWRVRKPYIESWWRPNITRGYLFLDGEPTAYLPWAVSTSPPYRIYEDTSPYKEVDRHGMRHAIRMFKVISQTFREEQDKGGGGGGGVIRWFVMADDDTVLFLDNLVEVLSRYDHRKYFYIGENSETVWSDVSNSFEMAFGGAGYALSYPLAEALTMHSDLCIQRYPFLWGSDHLLQSCLADLGVSLTHERGFHQIDLHGDISGLLSSHPQSPFLSLHHIDSVNPLFPDMNRSESLTQLMKAAKSDQSRLLQQTICYQKQSNWSFSVAWGYTVQLYESIIPPSVLHRPLQTFSPWNQPLYRFNTRWLPKNPCENPHVFFFEEVEEAGRDRIITRYGRRPVLRPPTCPSNGDNSSSGADHVWRVLVVSPTTRYGGVGSRRECCDVGGSDEKNTTRIKFRACLKDEIVG
ncbi:hypothetical protein Dimus_009177 [Dionaea muscipula]